MLDKTYRHVQYYSALESVRKMALRRGRQFVFELAETTQARREVRSREGL